MCFTVVVVVVVVVVVACDSRINWCQFTADLAPRSNMGCCYTTNLSGMILYIHTLTICFETFMTL